MGNMFSMTLKTSPSSIDDITESEEHTAAENQVNFSSQEETTFTPQNRAKYLFTLMDVDNDGRADYADFKRVVLADSEIIRGFLVYDGVI